MAMTSRERAIGALVGLAVGDAVGTTLEFKAPGTFTPIEDMVGGGPFRLKIGQWTDDTSMAMCLAESILDRGGLDPADQLRRYVAWRSTGYWSSTGRCFDIGNATSAALSRFERTGEVSEPLDRVNQEGAANGSLMRLAPVPIRWWNDVAVAAERSGESSLTTHAATRPVDACRAYGAMIAALIGGASLEEVLDPGFWRFGDLDPRVETVVRGSWRTKEPPAIRGTGYVVDALEAALWAVAGASDFRSAVLRAANLGDDADTTAAIAGQLAGAWWGVEGIPRPWRQEITFGPRIEAIASLLFDAAAGLGVGVGAGAEPVAVGLDVEPIAEEHPVWVHDELVHGYWIKPGRVLAGEYPGDRDPGVAERKLSVLLDHGVRTFVDLTTPEDRMVSYVDILERLADVRGLEVRHVAMPIIDNNVRPDEGYDEILDAIRSASEDGTVFVHCWGGLGRTTTVIGCLLVDDGSHADEAFAQLDSIRSATRKGHRPAPQTEAQRQVVRRRGSSGRAELER